MQSRQVFGRNRVIFDHRTKRNNWSFEWFAESTFIWVFPIRQKILYVSQIAVTLHGIRHHFSSRPDCNSTAEVPSWILHTASQRPHLFLTGEVLTYNDSKMNLHKLCQILCKCQCKWLLVFTSAPRSFVSSFLFPEVFVLHGYDWIIHWVAKSSTTTAHRWLFRDSLSSLGILWSAVIKSPKFSARSTAAPVRFLQGALVILVLMQMSQWSEKKILCLPDTTFPRGSWADSREELAGASLWAETLSSTRLSVNSSNHSGRSRNGFLRTVSLSPFLFVFSVSAGSCDGLIRTVLLVLPSCWCGMHCRNYCFLQYWCWRCRCGWAWRACR